MSLGIDEASVFRHPFPSPGMSILILGEVTPKNVVTLQQADAIMIEELHKSGHYRINGQAFVVLIPTMKSVGLWEMELIMRMWHSSGVWRLRIT